MYVYNTQGVGNVIVKINRQNSNFDYYYTFQAFTPNVSQWTPVMGLWLIGADDNPYLCIASYGEGTNYDNMTLKSLGERGGIESIVSGTPNPVTGVKLTFANAPVSGAVIKVYGW